MANGPARSTARGGEIYVGNEFRDFFHLLDVLCANQFEGEPFEPKLLEQIEENFYRGAPPNWLNFYISEQAKESGIIKRDGYNRLVQEIREKKKQPGISTVKLFHQPGCGGTTLAMQVLWGLRKSFRCAEVLTRSPLDIANVADAVIDLYTAGSSGHQNTVLLLVNDEQILENLQDSIMEKIAERKIVTHMPVVIFLSCIRKVSIVQNDNVALKGVLTDTEKQKFDEKKEELSLKYGDKCKQFHGFNIMQTNFSSDYVQQACNVFSTDRRANEPLKTELVACLSLLNDYVPGSYLTESQCLDFLRHEDDNYGDLEDRMEPFSHLITFQQDKRSGKKVSMAHPMIAQRCTEMLAEAGVTRSDTALKLISLYSNEDPPYLLGFVKDMLTKREPKKEENLIYLCSNEVPSYLPGSVKDTLTRREPKKENPISGTETDKEKEWFSRLILDIKKKEDNARSASVLEEASKRFDENPFFPQALARFCYIELNDYQLAEMWAIEAKGRDPKNSFVADTLGQVHKKHLKMGPKLSLSSEIAKKAIEAFKHEEELAENEIKEHGTTKVFNTAGKLGCLEVYNLLFYHDNDLLSRDEVEQKCTFLEKYVIYSKPAMMKSYATNIPKATESYRLYSQPKQFKQTDTDFIRKLKQILADTSTVLLSCLDREYTESLTVKKITTWWEEIFRPSSFKFQPNMPLGPEDKPELHLVSLLLCWPTDGEDKCEILSQVIKCMHKSYTREYKAYFQSRYLRPLFFIGKGQGLDRIVHGKVLEGLFPEGKEDWSKEQIFQHPMVRERLLQVEGVVREYRIYATIAGKEIEVKANLRNSHMRTRQVSFYLGVTITGPVAFGIQTTYRNNAKFVSEMDISNPGPSISKQPSCTDTMRASHQHFVDRHRTALINGVSDTEFILRKLQNMNWISNDTYIDVSVLNTTTNQMKGVLQCLTWSRAKDALLEILKGMKSMKALLRDLEETE